MTTNIVDKLKKKYEHILLDREIDDIVETISTGSLSLDVSTGVGGIPKRRVTTVYGAESSGKTTLCLEVAKNAILGGDNVAYIDVEQGLDYNYVETLVGKFDMDKLLIAQPETSEEALGLVEVLIHGDKKLGIEPGQYKLIIIDSVAALAPEIEKEKELTDHNVALTARTLTSFFRRNVYDLRKNNVALLFVNQVRAKIGSYIRGYELPGGHALKHYSSMIIFLSAGQKIKQGDNIIGMQCKFTIKKNKLSPPFRSFDFPLMFGEGIDYHRDLISFADEMGILRKRAAYYYYGDTQLGQGIEKSIAALKEQPELEKEIKEKCLSNINKTKEKLDNNEEE
jgi:recombination protein RecA